MGDSQAEAVLAFWFGEGATDEAVLDEKRAIWFRRDDATDATIEARFGELVRAAVQGGLTAWTKTPRDTLALIILLDQFTRNTHRGDAAAFAGDPRALALAEGLVARGEWKGLRPLERAFVLMPMMHAEDAEVQRRCVEAFRGLAASVEAGRVRDALAGFADYAERHRVIVERFGRFPHRNATLGRETTAEEAAFLKQPGSSF